jgi:hypothetical protein
VIHLWVIEKAAWRVFILEPKKPNWKLWARFLLTQAHNFTKEPE